MAKSAAEQSEEGGKSKKKLIIIIVAVLVLLIGAGVGAFLFMGGTKRKFRLKRNRLPWKYRLSKSDPW